MRRRRYTQITHLTKFLLSSYWGHAFKFLNLLFYNPFPFLPLVLHHLHQGCSVLPENVHFNSHSLIEAHCLPVFVDFSSEKLALVAISLHVADLTVIYTIDHFWNFKLDSEFFKGGKLYFS
jgi:hypothetical protein